MVVIEEFLEGLDRMISKDSIDDVLDYILIAMDDLLLIGNYEACDELLKAIDVSKYNTTILVCILTGSFSFKNALKYYKTFFNDVKTKTEEIFGESETDLILWGLDK